MAKSKRKNRKSLESRVLNAFTNTLNDLSSYLRHPNTQDSTEVQKEPRKETKEERFRISAKKLLLTYSQVPQEMKHEDLVEALRRTINFRNYVVGKELHKSSGGWHFHILLLAHQKFQIKNITLLDVHYTGTQ